MKTENLNLGQEVFFKGQVLPMKLKALGKRFAVCVRKLHKLEDVDLLNYEVERRAYNSFEEAFESLKDYPIYSCLDFDKRIRAPHNLIFNPYDFKKIEDIYSLLEDLESGEVELSGRHYTELHIDYERTI